VEEVVSRRTKVTSPLGIAISFALVSTKITGKPAIEGDKQKKTNQPRLRLKNLKYLKQVQPLSQVKTILIWNSFSSFHSILFIFYYSFQNNY